MNIQGWSFRTFEDWLTSKSDVLRADGFIIELQRNESPCASIRLRAEYSERVGELTVWDTGMASEAIIDLQIGSFIHMRDGIQLCGDWAIQLAEFFDKIAPQFKNAKFGSR